MEEIKKLLDLYFKTDCVINGDTIILFGWICIRKNYFGFEFWNDQDPHSIPFNSTEDELIKNIKQEFLWT